MIRQLCFSQNRGLAVFARTASLLVLLLTAVAFSASVSSAQGLLIASEPESQRRLPRVTGRILPTPPNREPGFIYDISKLEIDASIHNQVAQVQVGQTFKNCTSRTLQVKFVFPMPYDGAIDQMTFMVDGDELEGRMLEADKARDIYQSYVRRSQDPALVQWIGTGMYQTQVFPVPPGAERTVSLRYTQLCRRSGSLNDWLLPLSPAQYTSRPIGEVSVLGRIRTDSKLGNVYSPTHDVNIDRDGTRSVRFEYKAKNQVPKGDFRVMWDTGDDAVQMSLVTHRPDKEKDGFFMLMIQPEFPEPDSEYAKAGKNVVLVMDKSGSMRGDKIEQARRASTYVIDHLKSRDNFTLITYDSNVETFRSELASADKPTRADALDYIDSMLAGGSTNIDEAIARAFDATTDADGPVYVVFMTDGRPTVGERNAMKIAENAAKKFREGTRLFSLGVGHDVNSRLLDKLSEVCLGQSLYVRPGQPLDDVVSTLYDRIGAPALTDAKLKITVDGVEGGTRQLYPSKFFDLFSGDQLVIVGRYRKHGEVKIKLSGDFLGRRESFSFSDEFPKVTGSGKNAFVERLWATRRIGQIIDEIDLHGQDKELIDELVVLSKRHGILTPYTAYLAEERTDLNDQSQTRRLAESGLESLQDEFGASAFRQRALKSEFRSADRALAPAESESLARGALGRSGQTPAPSSSFGAGGGFGRGLGGRASSMRSNLSLSAKLDGIEESKENAPAQQRVKQIGSKTFFFKQNRYVDSSATKKQIEKPTKVEMFSDEYFALLKDLNEEEKKYLAESVEILVIIKGKPYLIVSPKKDEGKKQ